MILILLISAINLTILDYDLASNDFTDFNITIIVSLAILLMLRVK